MDLTGVCLRRSALLVLLATAGFGAAQQDPPPTSSLPPPSPDAQRQILARVNRESLRYQRELPKLICTQLTTRSVDTSGTGTHWKQRDRIEVEDDYVGRFVNHKLLMIDGKEPRKSYQQLTGFLSETVLYSLGFLPRWLVGPQAKTRFEWQNWSTLGDKPVQVYSLHLPASESQLVLSTDHQSVVAGIDGAMYVDATTALVQRLEVHLEVPANSIIQEGFVRIDFGSVTISERQYLLPLRAEVKARVGSSIERNETEVVRYQRYAADTKVLFDEAPQGEGSPDEPPPSK